MRLKDEEREKDLRKNEKNVEQWHGKKDEKKDENEKDENEKRDGDEENQKKDDKRDVDEKNQKKDDKKEDERGERCEDLKTGMKKEHSVTQVYEVQVMMS